MSGTVHNAVYRGRIRRMLPVGALVLGSFLTGLLLAPVAGAADWRAPEEQLAGKIVAVTGPGALALDVVNRSSLNPSDTETIRRGLLAELTSLGGRIVNADEAAATVEVSVTEDLENYVWVAQIRQGTNPPAVVMVSTPRHGVLVASRESPALLLRKSLLWSQDARILDVAVINSNPPHMIVLDPGAATLYKLQDNRWQPEPSLPIAHLHPWPRDLRGRLILRPDHLFDAYLPGVFCRSSGSAPVTLDCYQSDDPWPLRTGPMGLNAFFASTRNYFTGALAPGIGKKTTAPPFYSAAPVPRDQYTVWLFSGVDGQLHLLDGVGEQAARLDWGSDIASLHSHCGSGWQVLATSAGSGPDDAVRVFEVPDREPVAAGEPVEFSGVITALWPESDGSGAVAVAHNPVTEKYEAFRISIACGQ
jgi:hypothetical protein